MDKKRHEKRHNRKTLKGLALLLCLCLMVTGSMTAAAAERTVGIGRMTAVCTQSMAELSGEAHADDAGADGEGNGSAADSGAVTEGGRTAAGADTMQTTEAANAAGSIGTSDGAGAADLTGNVGAANAADSTAAAGSGETSSGDAAGSTDATAGDADQAAASGSSKAMEAAGTAAADVQAADPDAGAEETDGESGTIEAAVDSQSQTSGRVISGGVFQYTYIGSQMAFCTEHNKMAPSDGDTYTLTAQYSSADHSDKVHDTIEMAMMILYYGYNGPGSLGTADAHTTNAALSYVLGNGDDETVGADFWTSIKEKDVVPKGFTLYLWSRSTGDSVQDSARQIMATYDYVYTPEDAKVYLVKGPAAGAPASITGRQTYSLSGAVYRVYSDSSLKNQVGTLTTGTGGTSNTLTLPAEGTYYYKEVTAPEGYALDSTVHSIVCRAGETTKITATDRIVAAYSGLTITKRDMTTGEISEAFAGTQFTVRYYDGYYTLETLPAKAVYTWIIEVNDRTGKTLSAALDEAHYVGGSSLIMVDGQPAIPLGTITVEETLPAAGYTTEGMYFTDQDGQKLGDLYLCRITQSGQTVKSSVSTDINAYDRKTEIGTRAACLQTGTGLCPAGEETTISDYVRCEGLMPGTDYVLTGTLMDQESGEPLLMNGEEVIGVTDFTAESAEEEVTVTFSLDSRELAGRKLVVFESLSIGEEIAAEHRDLTAESQTLWIPHIATRASEKTGGGQQVIADGEVTLTDTVDYDHLQAGETYTLQGTLISKKTGEPITADGEVLQSEITFTPEAESGQITLDFTLDGTALAGDTVVIFESLLQGDTAIAVHQDIEDEAQSVCFEEKPAESESETVTETVKETVGESESETEKSKTTESETETETGTDKQASGSPATGDDRQPLTWCCLMAAALMLLIGLGLYGKRRRR